MFAALCRQRAGDVLTLIDATSTCQRWWSMSVLVLNLLLTTEWAAECYYEPCHGWLGLFWWMCGHVQFLIDSLSLLCLLWHLSERYKYPSCWFMTFGDLIYPLSSQNNWKHLCIRRSIDAERRRMCISLRLQWDIFCGWWRDEEFVPRKTKTVLIWFHFKFEANSEVSQKT